MGETAIDRRESGWLLLTLHGDFPHTIKPYDFLNADDGSNARYDGATSVSGRRQDGQGTGFDHRPV